MWNWVRDKFGWGTKAEPKNLLDPKFAARLEQQLSKDGPRSLYRSLDSLEKRLAEHKEKLSTLQYKSSVEREIRTFENQVYTLKEFLKRNNL